MDTSVAAQTSDNLAIRLKTETATLHDNAEGHAFQQTFAAGKLPQETYVRYLGQMYLVYSALEAEINKVRASTDALSSVIADRNFRVPDLAADLDHFGCDKSQLKPGPAAQALIDEVHRTASSNPTALLGFHYVLEGSNNGTKFIARNVRRAYKLTDAGVRYLDPYGDEQHAVWGVYKQAMASLDLPGEQADAIVRSAQTMFRGVSAISAELHG